MLEYVPRHRLVDALRPPAARYLALWGYVIDAGR